QNVRAYCRLGVFADLRKEESCTRAWFGLIGHVQRIAASSGPEIHPSRLVSPFLRRLAKIIAPAPCRWDQARIIPSRLNACAVPTAAVIQDKRESALVACARALHDVEVVIREQDLRWAGCVLFMNFNKRVNAVSIVRLARFQL